MCLWLVVLDIVVLEVESYGNDGFMFFLFVLEIVNCEVDEDCYIVVLRERCSDLYFFSFCDFILFYFKIK